jgi:hypothetical protein
MNSTSFLGSPAFARVFRTIGGRDVYWVAQLNGQPVAALTAVEFGHKPLKRLQSMPDGLYSSLVMLDDSGRNAPDAAKAILEAIAGAGYAKLYVNDFYGQLVGANACETIDCYTTLVDIARPGWRPPDKKIRSEIRKAEREGIRLLKFDPGRHFHKFLALMEGTERRHGRQPKYSAEFFGTLAELAREDERIHWVYVDADSQAAASHIYFVENDMVLNWQIYFDKAFSHLKPNQYILFHTALKLAGQGVTTLNLGASPAGADGLVEQKQKWGGRAFRYPCYCAKSMLGHLL